MPPGSSDKSQQSMGSGFPGSSLYPNNNIWTSSLSNARERSAVNHGAFIHSLVSPLRGPLPHPDRPFDSFLAMSESEGSASGSSALAANSEADVWSSHPWKNNIRPTRSVSTSPNRTRDAPVPNHGGYYEHVPPSAIGMNKGSFGATKPFPDDASIYGPAFPPQQRQAAAAAESSYVDSLSAYPQARDSSLPSSRQSQASPALQDLYHGHTPSNSIHSQRAAVGNHAPSYSSQSANQRAFNLNKQVQEDLSLQFGRRVNLDNTGSSAASAAFVNPAPQPFQFNPGSQPWMSEATNSRHVGALQMNTTDALPTQYNVIKRASIDRVSNASEYRLPNGNSSSTYPASPDTWPTRPSPRDPRINDLERRSNAPQFPAAYDPSFYANQYSYTNLPPQYAPAQNFLSIYAQAAPPTFRHNIIPAAAYNLPSVHSPYAHALAATHSPAMHAFRDQDPSKGVRSALLDEFRVSNKLAKRYELKDIFGHVVEFSGDQHGSRFIQQKLESANSEEKDQVFREMEPNAIQLMKDVFGNYVVQKFFEYGNQVQKKVLAERMKGKVVDLSVQVYACRVMQKALEHVLVEQQAELTKELEPEILRVIRDQNGNHVVQKIIELVPRQHIDFIMDALRGQVTLLASHTYGCRVIQRMLEHGTEVDKMEIMAELHASAQMLITDQYGNYVAQHVIQNGKPADRARMIDLVMAQLLNLSKHKFASNVVEKCIEHGSAEQRSMIREQLTTVGSDGISAIQQMMRDQYGNYVIQKLLAQLQGSEREILVDEIRPQFYAMRKSGTSRQLTALEKLLGLPSPDSPLTKTESSGGQADANPTVDLPALTNGTSSPLSNSPRSAHVSTVGIPTEDNNKSGPEKLSSGVKPQLREEVET
ncbi:hypothetical protein E4U53_007587 [Claviceps sorghi]|nr:hypothetical protein E4U53_007587 [Claviceps sorghi]